MRSAIGLLFAGAVQAGASAATVTSFTLPNGDKTCGIGIALDGTVVGTDETYSNPAVNFAYHAGNFSLPQPLVPAGLVTISGVNSSHVMVGADFTTNAQLATTTYAFKLSGGATTVLSLPNIANIAAVGINDAGTIVGWLQGSAANAPNLGFIYTGSQMTTLYAGPGNDIGGSTIATAINAAGTVVVGTYLSSGALTSWMYQNQVFTPIAFPKATITAARGTWGDGWVSGTYYTGKAPKLASHGFLYHAGKYFRFSIKGATDISLAGANEHGQFTGCYTDSKGTHGIIASLK